MGPQAGVYLVGGLWLREIGLDFDFLWEATSWLILSYILIQGRLWLCENRLAFDFLGKTTPWLILSLIQIPYVYWCQATVTYIKLHIDISR